MVANPKEWIATAGGAVAVGFIVFGAGLYLLGSVQAKGGGTPEAAKAGSQAPAAHGTAENAKIDETASVSDREHWIAKGDAALARGKADDAISFYDRAVKVSPDQRNDPAMLMRIGESTLRSEILPAQLRNEKALATFSRIINEFPEFEGGSRALYLSGQCYKGQGRWDEAVEAFGKYVERFPNGPYVVECRLDQAEGLLAQEKPQAALEIVQPLLGKELDPGSQAKVLSKLATIKLHLARLGKVSETPVSTAVVKPIITQPITVEAKTTVAQHPAELPKVQKIAEEPKNLTVKPAKEEVPAIAAKTQKEEVAPPPAKPLAEPVATETKAAPAEPAAVSAPAHPTPVSEAKPAQPTAPAAATENLGVPNDQWVAIKDALRHGKVREARRLISPWLDKDSPDTEGLAALWMEWARLLQEVTKPKAATAVPVPPPADQTALGEQP